MIRWFRGLLSALEAIRDALGGITEAVHALRTNTDVDPALESRVADLELRLERHMAEAEALMLKAKGKFDAARASEERTRRLADSAPGVEEGEEELTEDELREAYAAAGIHLGNAEAEPPEGVQPLPSRMDRRRQSKQNALALKWSR